MIYLQGFKGIIISTGLVTCCMNRRKILMAGSTAMSVGLAGCSGLLGGGNDGEGPARPRLAQIRIETNGGAGQVTGQISNPTEEAVDACDAQ